jgi:hypothetical protein
MSTFYREPFLEPSHTPRFSLPSASFSPNQAATRPSSLMSAPLLLPCYSWLAPPLPLPCPSRVLTFLHTICYCLAAGGCCWLSLAATLLHAHHGCCLPCCAAVFPCCLALLACCSIALLAWLLRCFLRCLAAACLLHAICCLPLVIKRQEWSCSSRPCSPLVSHAHRAVSRFEGTASRHHHSSTEPCLCPWSPGV